MVNRIFERRFDMLGFEMDESESDGIRGFLMGWFLKEVFIDKCVMGIESNEDKLGFMSVVALLSNLRGR